MKAKVLAILFVMIVAAWGCDNNKSHDNKGDNKDTTEHHDANHDDTTNHTH